MVSGHDIFYDKHGGMAHVKFPGYVRGRKDHGKGRGVFVGQAGFNGAFGWKISGLLPGLVYFGFFIFMIETFVHMFFILTTRGLFTRKTRGLHRGHVFFLYFFFEYPDDPLNLSSKEEEDGEREVEGTHQKDEYI